jgi:hypothetical protein
MDDQNANREGRGGVNELYDFVVDQESFIAFVTALADERQAAQELEKRDPIMYMDGALGWANCDIQSFLYNCLDYFEKKPFSQPEKEPSWRMFADFLHRGKIIE